MKQAERAISYRIWSLLIWSQQRRVKRHPVLADSNHFARVRDRR
ncbi:MULTISPECIES: hypothetical protein [unclassified Nostoc]|nr:MULTISPECIES: hypothetical protein [unclassified Nostoc]MDM9585254.1 hypothetical protein [Nostoc sp. GT001]MDZ7945352.1 hypothetical protein [Nostoc sp. EfeVER01]MDZ7993437.1 hypothetical protein [Nostoc sp. EspVER01]